MAGPASWLLAIDTSTVSAGVAAKRGDRVASRTWISERTQTQTLAPQVKATIGELGVELSDLSAIAVSTGPGTFTGLRVGLSYAKGLAMLDDLPIIGVPTLELIARPMANLGHEGIAVIPAGRGRVVWSRFSATGEVDPATNSSFEAFRAVCAEHPETVVSGELLDDQRAALEGEGVHLAASPATRAEVLAEVGWDHWIRGKVDDLATLVPQYLHGNPNPRQGRDGGLSGPRG